MMPQEFDQAIKAMCGDAVAQAISTLAEKYGVDAEEASRVVNLDALKIVRKRGPSPKRAEEKSVAKSKKATKANADEPEKPKVKRGPTGYILYAGSVRPDVRAEMEAELVEEGVKLKPQDVVKAIAVRWKALTEAERGEWNTKAKTPEVSEGEQADNED